MEFKALLTTCFMLFPIELRSIRLIIADLPRAAFSDRHALKHHHLSRIFEEARPSSTSQRKLCIQFKIGNAIPPLELGFEECEPADSSNPIFKCKEQHRKRNA